MKYLCVHNTAVKRSQYPQLYGVNRYHRGKWGMKSSLGWYVGYNFFIDVDGTLTQTRRVGEETIANRGHNCDIPSRCDTVSVCFAMKGDVEWFNKAQEQTWRKIRTRFADLEVTLHKNLQKNRTCPGKNITIEYLKSLLVEPNEDKEKEKMVELQSKLDLIRQLLAKLQAKLKKHVR